MTHRAIALSALLASLAAGCALFPRSGVPSCPEPPMAPERIAPDLARRFHYRVESAAGDRFVAELIAERQGDELVLVGLTPLGATAFALRWRRHRRWRLRRRARRCRPRCLRSRPGKRGTRSRLQWRSSLARQSSSRRRGR